MEIEKKLQTENIKCGSGLNQVRIFVYGLTDNIFNIIADMTFGIFIQLIRIDRFSVLNYYVGFLYSGHMFFKDFCCVVQGNRNNGASGLCRYFKSAVFKRQHAQLFAFIARAFRKNADGNSIFNIVDSLQNGF